MQTAKKNIYIYILHAICIHMHTCIHVTGPMLRCPGPNVNMQHAFVHACHRHFGFASLMFFEAAAALDGQAAKVN